MKKNGFISISVLYSFFIVFILLTTIILTSYTKNNLLIGRTVLDIKESFINKKNDTTKIYYLIFNEDDNNYEYSNEINENYIYNATKSYCKNGSKIINLNNNYVIDGNGIDICYVYFDPIERG